jgi:feruloyl esterase
MDRNFKTCFLDSTRYFRVTHANDGIVPVPYLNESYVHQGLELWSSADPASPNNTFVCPSEGFCCETAGGLGLGINDAHNAYFNVSAGTCSQDV